MTGGTSAVQAERLQFSARLKLSMDKVSMPHSSTRLTHAFNSLTTGSPITSHAVRKWLMGESIPTQLKIQELAAMFGCEAQWLRFGETEMKFTEPRLSAFDAELQRQFSFLSKKEQGAVFDLIKVLAENRK
jgi:hypothetical protein